MIEVTYQVYRFWEWHTSCYMTQVSDTLWLKKIKWFKTYLEKLAYKNDYWPIRNLKYKILKQWEIIEKI